MFMFESDADNSSIFKFVGKKLGDSVFVFGVIRNMINLLKWKLVIIIVMCL